jgi:hypothetical protein
LQVGALGGCERGASVGRNFAFADDAEVEHGVEFGWARSDFDSRLRQKVALRRKGNSLTLYYPEHTKPKSSENKEAVPGTMSEEPMLPLHH